MSREKKAEIKKEESDDEVYISETDISDDEDIYQVSEGVRELSIEEKKEPSHQTVLFFSVPSINKKKDPNCDLLYRKLIPCKLLYRTEFYSDSFFKKRNLVYLRIPLDEKLEKVENKKGEEEWVMEEIPQTYQEDFLAELKRLKYSAQEIKKYSKVKIESRYHFLIAGNISKKEVKEVLDELSETHYFFNIKGYVMKPVYLG